MNEKLPPQGKARTTRYDLVELARVWNEVRVAPPMPPDHYPGLQRGPGEAPIKRLRVALLDPHIGLGMQLRWNIALEALRRNTAATGAAMNGWDATYIDCSLPDGFHRLGSSSHDEATARAFQAKATAKTSLEGLCAILNGTFGEHYRKVALRHRMTPALFQIPYHGAEAVEEFDHLLHSGEESRYCRANRTLLPLTKQFFPNAERSETERKIIARLSCPNGGRPIQCITAPGAQTAVEALALHLAESLPAALQQCQGPRRDIFLVPCGRWVKPYATRGMEYLVRNLVNMLDQAGEQDASPDMPEEQLRRQIDWLRNSLGQRPVILIFVGNDAFTGPLVRLQEAIVDAPLAGLLSHLSRPALGGPELAYEARHFEWSYFLVVGTAEMCGLGEYKQETLPLPAILRTDYLHVLHESAFQHAEEIYQGMVGRKEVASEAESCLFEQIRRLEVAAARRKERSAKSSLGLLVQYRLPDLAAHFFDALYTAQRPTTQALVLLTAFAIGGIRRTTLVRCLALWGDVFPGAHLDPFPASTEQWAAFFDEWLECFAPVISSGPDEKWQQIDSLEHPFEYPDATALAPAAEQTAGWQESIDFLIVDVRNAIVTHVQEHHWELAEGIHRILAEEALRQHLIALRHTQPADRLTIRTYRRGLQALYHGLASLPPDFDVHSDSAEKGRALVASRRLPVKHMRRFRYLYCGLFSSLLRDPGVPNGGALWGAEAIALEVATFADDLLFQRLGEGDVAPPRLGGRAGEPVESMCQAHYSTLAIAGARLGPQAGLDQLRVRLAPFVRRQCTLNEGSCTPVEIGTLQMALIQSGPEHPDTGRAFRSVARRLRIDLRDFDAELWGSPAMAQQRRFPTAADFHKLIARHAAKGSRMAAQPRASFCSILLFYGIWRFDLAQAHLLHGHEGSDRARNAIAGLLKCVAALAAARHVMWDSFGDGHFQLPYLAAEGLQTLCSVGMEIVRLARTAWPGPGPRPVEAAELVAAVNACVRRTLDDYAQMLHGFEGERTHMLVLEARYARIASDVASHLAQARRAGYGATPRRNDELRCTVAMNFIAEVDARLLTFFATDALQMRLQSERCSTLRLRAANLLREADSASVAAERARALHGARTAGELAWLGVRQMRNLLERLKQDAGGACVGREAQWAHTVQHHEAALVGLRRRLQ